MENKNKIKSFTDLTVWQEARRLAVLIYKITMKFPKEEVFGLVIQMRRASISIASNLAEGFPRRSYKEKIQFYTMALGSLTELHNQAIISKDIDYLNDSDFNEIQNQVIIVYKLINAFIRKTKSFSS